MIVVQRPALATGGVSGGAGDPDFASVVLLLGFEGVDGATSTTDESSSAHAITVGLGAQIDTAQKKFGLSSVLMDGANDVVYAGDHVDFEFGANPFTIEGWFRWDAIGSSYTGVVSKWKGLGNSRQFSLEYNETGGALEFWISNNGSTSTKILTDTWTPTTGVWYHLVVDRDGSDDFRLYRDGTFKDKTNYTSAISTAGSPNMGVGNIQSARNHNGWADEIRITKGVARYASDSGYIVPSAAFPRST
jgi:hypothetical protein